MILPFVPFGCDHSDGICLSTFEDRPAFRISQAGRRRYRRRPHSPAGYWTDSRGRSRTKRYNHPGEGSAFTDTNMGNGHDTGRKPSLTDCAACHVSLHSGREFPLGRVHPRYHYVSVTSCQPGQTVRSAVSVRLPGSIALIGVLQTIVAEYMIISLIPPVGRGSQQQPQ